MIELGWAVAAVLLAYRFGWIRGMRVLAGVDSTWVKLKRRFKKSDMPEGMRPLTAEEFAKMTGNASSNGDEHDGKNDRQYL